MSIGIRLATAADASAIAEIYAHYVEHSAATFDEPPAPDAQAFAERIEGGRLPFLVASSPDGAITGYAYLGPYIERSAYRHTASVSVYVAPDARGGGIGRKLLEELLREGAAAGIEQAIAIIAVTEDPASIALHARCGFKEAGRLTRVGLKFGRWYDVVLMQRELNARPD